MIRSPARLMNTHNIRDISSELLLPNGKMRLLFAGDYNQYTYDELRMFCHFYARYGIPTIELIGFLQRIINDHSVIEIGAGAGDLGYHLGIKMTDSKLQEKPEIKEYYEMMGQPVIKYPADVERLDAIEAIYKYKPKVVIGSWITPYSPRETNFASSAWGVKEDKILKLVDTYIMIGNMDIHETKPILKFPHDELFLPWIRSRHCDQDKNCIFIWNKK